MSSSVFSRKSMSSGGGYDVSVGEDDLQLDLNYEIRSSSEPQSEIDPFIKGNNTRFSKAIIGKMFFKTKLCCKFRAGICPYITNCNFAHGIEELRRPPPNWQDIISSYEEQEGVTAECLREENQIPSFTSYEMTGESQRSYKGRHCKKFYTEEGCPYGDGCTFLHDEQSRSRESVAISLSPAMGGCGNNGNGGGQNQKPSNWKTRICNKWETTGSCPFGSKCHFAHGLQELHRYGGGLLDMLEGKESSSSSGGLAPPLLSQECNGGQGVMKGEGCVNNTEGSFHGGGRVIPAVIQKQSPSQFHLLHKWKGPEKISRIYGDWIDDFQ